MALILRNCGHRELEHYYSLFEVDFDKKEILPRLGVHRAMLKGDMELLAVTDEESRLDLAYALVGCRSLYGADYRIMQRKLSLEGPDVPAYPGLDALYHEILGDQYGIRLQYRTTGEAQNA